MIEKDTSLKSSQDTGTFLTEHQLAARWQLSVKKLQADRWKRVGVPFLKLGRCVRYSLDDVCAYERAQRSIPVIDNV